MARSNHRRGQLAHRGPSLVLIWSSRSWRFPFRSLLAPSPSRARSCHGPAPSFGGVDLTQVLGRPIPASGPGRRVQRGAARRAPAAVAHESSEDPATPTGRQTGGGRAARAGAIGFPIRVAPRPDARSVPQCPDRIWMASSDGETLLCGLAGAWALTWSLLGECEGLGMSGEVCSIGRPTAVRERRPRSFEFLCLCVRPLPPQVHPIGSEAHLVFVFPRDQRWAPSHPGC